jgi:hypothetical protein
MENNITAIDDLLSQDKYAFFRDYIYNNAMVVKMIVVMVIMLHFF